MLSRLSERLGGVTSTGGTLTALGRSVCSTEPVLDGPAIWTARIVDGKVSE